jgi:hypothetical protein
MCQYDRRWLDRLASVTAIMRWAGIVLALLLGCASAVTVANVVRLTLYARRDEIEIMQLVGTPLGRIRGPFVAEGILQGGAGSVVALLALAAVYAVVHARYSAAIARLVGGLSVQFLPVPLVDCPAVRRHGCWMPRRAGRGRGMRETQRGAWAVTTGPALRNSLPQSCLQRSRMDRFLTAWHKCKASDDLHRVLPGRIRKHQRCLQQQREYYRRAVDNVETALGRLLRLDQFCSQQDADQS